MPDPIRQLTDLMREQGLPTTGQSAIDWYRKAVRRLEESTTKQIFRNRDRVGQLLPGHMYMFRYIPEGRKELDYYDEYPLMIATNTRDTSYFRGLNLHYLPHKYRAVFFANIQSSTSNRKYNEETRFRLTNKMVTKMSKYRYGRVCFRTYSYGQLRSKVIEIKPSEWFASLFLPTERFVKKSRASVWRESRKQIDEN